MYMERVASIIVNQVSLKSSTVFNKLLTAIISLEVVMVSSWSHHTFINEREPGWYSFTGEKGKAVITSAVEDGISMFIR